MGMSDAENNDKMDIGQSTIRSNQNLTFTDNNDNKNNEQLDGTTHGNERISNKNNNNQQQISDHQQEQNQHQQQNEQENILRDKHTVHWFRKGLRLHDNPALIEGLKGATTFRCVFIIDPWFAGSSNVGINKWRFLLQCLEDLDRSLRNLNSRLFVIRGQPADALPKLFKAWNTTCLTFEEDPEPFGRVRDHNITEMCKELGISVISAVSHTLYKLEKIIEKNNGRAPLTYNQFQAIIASMNPPPPAHPTITQETLDNIYTPFVDDHDDKFGVPTLEELGFETDGIKPPVWIGGETEALTRLERHLERKAWVASFGRPKMTPQSLQASQTGLSPYLRFGCLSTRLFYHQLTDLYKKIKNAYPPLSLHGQLLWREFFYCAATKNPNFDKMASNPICVQIPWDTNSDALAKWANGHTGFPWIDAIMTQLREEGWIHHLARHAVACFLTRGDLWVSWEEGMKVFEELLLDADWSVNAGMWMWLSCSSFFQQFFHCYCPVRFGRKADPNGDYIRKYLPVLKNFPTKYIHEPWNAPESVQRTAKCIIGREYSLPMVNHAVVSRTNMERMKQVYQQLAKYRDSSCTDGSNKGDSVIFGMLAAAKAQSGAAFIQMSSPSPSTIIARVNNSGNLMCRSNPIPTVTINEHLEPNQQPTSHCDRVMTNEGNNNNIVMNTVHGNQPNHYVKNLQMRNQQENLTNYQQIMQQHQEMVPQQYIQQQYFKNMANAEINAKIDNFVEEENHQNSQYNRIILHRNVVYNLNNPMHEQLSMDDSINYQNQSELNLHSTNMVFSNNNSQNNLSYRNDYKIESNNINESQNYNNYKFINSNEQNNYNMSMNNGYDGSQNRSPNYFDKRPTIINHHQASPNGMSDMKQLQIDENDETKLNLSVNIGCNLNHSQ